MSFPTASSLFMLSSIILSITLLMHVRCEDDDSQSEKLIVQSTFKPEPCARKAKATDRLSVIYSGQLKDSGTVFDSAHDAANPFKFQLGIGQVILGWEKGLLGACVGEKRRLTIPPHLAYGDNQHEVIPAKSTLIFDIEIIDIEDGPKPANVFKEIDADGDNRLSRKEVADFLKKQLNQASQAHNGDMGSVDDPEQVQMVDEIFMHEDKDKDEYITHDEFSGPKHDHDEL